MGRGGVARLARTDGGCGRVSGGVLCSVRRLTPVPTAASACPLAQGDWSVQLCPAGCSSVVGYRCTSRPPHDIF